MHIFYITQSTITVFSASLLGESLLLPTLLFPFLEKSCGDVGRARWKVEDAAGESMKGFFCAYPPVEVRK